jgi:tRNA(fMet)-specific endonuclease VapC
MIEILVDTSAYSALYKGNREIKKIFHSADRINFPIITIGELRAGFRLGNREEKNRELLRERLDTEGTSILYLDNETAEHYSDIFAELRRVGTPIPTNDIWIAALARQYKLPVCSLDGHFNFVNGLTVIGPQSGE